MNPVTLHTAVDLANHAIRNFDNSVTQMEGLRDSFLGLNAVSMPPNRDPRGVPRLVIPPPSFIAKYNGQYNAGTLQRPPSSWPITPKDRSFDNPPPPMHTQHVPPAITPAWRLHQTSPNVLPVNAPLHINTQPFSSRLSIDFSSPEIELVSIASGSQISPAIDARKSMARKDNCLQQAKRNVKPQSKKERDLSPLKETQSYAMKKKCTGCQTELPADHKLANGFLFCDSCAPAPTTTSKPSKRKQVNKAPSGPKPGQKLKLSNAVKKAVITKRVVKNLPIVISDSSDSSDNDNSCKEERQESGKKLKFIKKNPGMFGHKFKPVPRPSHAISPTRSPDENKYANRLTRVFPPENEIEFKLVPKGCCQNPACGKKFKNTRFEQLLCKECQLWNHVYCVDHSSNGYYNSKFTGSCVYCKQMELKAGMKEVKMEKHLISLDDNENECDPELPFGDPERDWNIYFNIFKNSHNIKVGDVVFARTRGDPKHVNLFWVYYLITDSHDRRFVIGSFILLPNEIDRVKRQGFYAKEAFPTRFGEADDISIIPLNSVVARAALLDRKDYFMGRPRGMMHGDFVFVYDHYYDMDKPADQDEAQHIKIDQSDHTYKYFKLNKKEYAWKEFIDKWQGVLKKDLLIDTNDPDTKYKPIDMTFKEDTLV